MEDIKDVKDVADNMEREKDDANVIDQKSDHEERDRETKTVTDGGKSGESVLTVLLKQRDKVLKRLNRVRRELDDIKKKCFVINDQKEKVIEDINDDRIQIEAPDLLKADLEKLQRLKCLVMEKESAMKTQACLKKQTVMILEQQLAIQEKHLPYLLEITKKKDLLSNLNHSSEIVELDRNEFEKVSEFMVNMGFMEILYAEVSYKLINFTAEVMCDHVSYSSKLSEVQELLDDMFNNNKKHSIETMKFAESEVKKLNLHLKNFVIYRTTFLNELKLVGLTHFQLINPGGQVEGMSMTN